TRVNETTGERTSGETTTRSAPLITNVPLSVIHGKSPRKTSCSVTSPVSLFTSSTRAQSGLEKVRSFVRHSSSEYLGSRNSLEMNFRSRFFPVKSWIGEISANSSPSPSSQNHLKESICVWIRFGSGRTSGSDAKLRRARTDAGTRSRVTDMGGPSSGLMAGQVDRRRGLYLWQGQYRIPDLGARSISGNRSRSTSSHSVSRGLFSPRARNAASAGTAGPGARG